MIMQLFNWTNVTVLQSYISIFHICYLNCDMNFYIIYYIIIYYYIIYNIKVISHVHLSLLLIFEFCKCNFVTL